MSGMTMNHRPGSSTASGPISHARSSWLAVPLPHQPGIADHAAPLGRQVTQPEHPILDWPALALTAHAITPIVSTAPGFSFRMLARRPGPAGGPGPECPAQ